MLRFVFPSESNREDVLAFYAAFEKNGGQCIGCKYGKDYALWLTDMQNRRAGKNLPRGMCRKISISATAEKRWWACAA